MGRGGRRVPRREGLAPRLRLELGPARVQPVDLGLGLREGLEPRGNAQAIRARVPLATMFGYATDLRSTTQGRATYTMQFDRYEEVPGNLAESIVEGRTGEPVGAGA